MAGKSNLVAALAALAAAMAIPASAGATTVLKANMTGAQVANPEGGAPQGEGAAVITVHPRRGRLCFEISYWGLGGKAIGGHLRRGGPGKTSRPMATLFVGRSPSPVSGCLRDLPRRPLRRLERKPQKHFVDLTTRRYERGAVRGQLRPQVRNLGGPSGGAQAPWR